VQLWAMWAINQVCSKNPERYCPLLKEEGLATVLALTSASARTSQKVRQLAINVADVMKGRGFLSLEQQKLLVQ